MRVTAEAEARWEAILDALDAVTPLVEDGGNAAFCEMRGIAGDPIRWLHTVTHVLTPFEIPFALGIGPNRFVASVAARGKRTCARGEEADFVAPMPLDVLPLDPHTCERLRMLGVRTLGELAALPHGPFVRRFGPQAARWHELARGIDDVPLVPRPRRVTIERTLFGEGSAASEEALLFALRSLVARIVDDLVVLGQRAAALVLSLQCEDGEMHEIQIRIAHPTAREGMLFDLTRAHLEGVRLQAPVEGLRLRIERMESGGTPMSLFSTQDPDAEAVELALARLEAALGEGVVLRAFSVDGYRPERQVVYERFSANMMSKRHDKPHPNPEPPKPTMQLRVFEPRAIDLVMQAGVPRFAGTPPQTIVNYAGPWRTVEDWWSNTPLTCDDYDIMLDDGTLCRIAHRAQGWFLVGVYD
ncbi:MAG TPA: DNA polymerase Y family protein [Candidatus Acidoferrales bacterium]|nr:DNA polymerase Y family protein [Candidatus Acidoferrales bacterium]